MRKPTCGVDHILQARITELDRWSHAPCYVFCSDVGERLADAIIGGFGDCPKQGHRRALLKLVTVKVSGELPDQDRENDICVRDALVGARGRYP
jgi:hypothetical protein